MKTAGAISAYLNGLFFLLWLIIMPSMFCTDPMKCEAFTRAELISTIIGLSILGISVLTIYYTGGAKGLKYKDMFLTVNLIIMAVNIFRLFIAVEYPACPKMECGLVVKPATVFLSIIQILITTVCSVTDAILEWKKKGIKDEG